jgi:hypothetical protein
MKKSELQQLIKEEISKALNEISTFEKKEFEDILADINQCKGEEGMKKLVKMQSLWSNMSKSDKIRGRVLKAIKNRLEAIGY